MALFSHQPLKHAEGTGHYGHQPISQMGMSRHREAGTCVQGDTASSQGSQEGSPTSLMPSYSVLSFSRQEENVLGDMMQGLMFRQDAYSWGWEPAVQKPSMTKCFPAILCICYPHSVLIPHALQLYQMWRKLHVP